MCVCVCLLLVPTHPRWQRLKLFLLVHNVNQSSTHFLFSFLPPIFWGRARIALGCSLLSCRPLWGRICEVSERLQSRLRPRQSRQFRDKRLFALSNASFSCQFIFCARELTANFLFFYFFSFVLSRTPQNPVGNASRRLGKIPY